jgi:hypothetical protein
VNKARGFLLAGLGVTPAFIVTDGLQARTSGGVAIEPTASSAPSIPLAQETLKSTLLQLSPTEKLRLAGDRIRLARVTTPTISPPPKPPPQPQTVGGIHRPVGGPVFGSDTVRSRYTVGSCSGMLFAWK